MSDNDFTTDTDPTTPLLLDVLTAVACNSGHLRIVLHLGDVSIEGTLTSPQAYGTALLEHATSARCLGDVRALEKAVLGENGPRQQYIYLKDAVVQGAGHPLRVEWWRGFRSSVSAVSIPYRHAGIQDPKVDQHA